MSINELPGVNYMKTVIQFHTSPEVVDIIFLDTNSKMSQDCLNSVFFRFSLFLFFLISLKITTEMDNILVLNPLGHFIFLSIIYGSAASPDHLQ